MFDIEQILKGYTKEDEFIARDIIILNLLISKNIITNEEVMEAFSKLPDVIDSVKSTRENEISSRAEQLKNKYKEAINEEGKN